MDKFHQKRNDSKTDKSINRRSLLKLGATGIVALFGIKEGKEALAAKDASGGKSFAMVIDLQRCTGCGGCILTCKSENNVQSGVAWSNKITRTAGKFPNVRFEYIPTLCNHCKKAPCVRGCPTNAMHKGYGDITMHDPRKCIGCKTCKAVCPYKTIIHINRRAPHKYWTNDETLLEGSTSSPRELVRKIKSEVIPYYNPDKEKSFPGAGLRYKGISEKCTFCDHRVKDGKLPFCVTGCPANARIFGDLNDPNSEVSKILGKYRPWRLKEHLGTEPKVFYVRSFNPGTYQTTKGNI